VAPIPAIETQLQIDDPPISKLREEVLDKTAELSVISRTARGRHLGIGRIRSELLSG